MQYDIARRAKQFPAVLAWWLGLLLCCGIPTLGEAAVEGIPCTPEPTDMIISYGDVVTCAIDVIGDTDVFRF